MKLIFKDKSLEEDLSYYIYDYERGWRGRNRNPFLDTRPRTPFFEARFRFTYFNVKESQKFLNLLHNLMILGHYIDEIIIEKEFEPNSLYEKIYILSYGIESHRNPNILEYKVHFEALKLSPVLTPKQKREYDVMVLIHNGELFIGDNSLV